MQTRGWRRGYIFFFFALVEFRSGGPYGSAPAAQERKSQVPRTLLVPLLSSSPAAHTVSMQTTMPHFFRVGRKNKGGPHSSIHSDPGYSRVPRRGNLPRSAGSINRFSKPDHTPSSVSESSRHRQHSQKWRGPGEYVCPISAIRGWRVAFTLPVPIKINCN